MDVDETSKLWGMLYQTPYALSVVYQAALVFIDGRESPVPGRPVERPEVRVLPFGAPGAPVPPGAEPTADATSSEAASEEVVHEKADPPAATPAKKAAKAPAKTVAKTPAKTPARPRKAAPRAAKPAQE
jgi:hypothetical protein